MTDTSLSSFLQLVSGRRGHFLLESGYHAELWLDLDPLFADAKAVEPFVAALAEKLRTHSVEVVCGPLLGGAFLAQRIAQILEVEFCFTQQVKAADATGLYTAQYKLPATFHDRIAGKRVAIVDDVMSAGSSLRATNAELKSHGANVVTAAALLVLGENGLDHFTNEKIPVEYINRDNFKLFSPDNCPHCAAGMQPQHP